MVHRITSLTRNIKQIFESMKRFALLSLNIKPFPDHVTKSAKQICI